MIKLEDVMGLASLKERPCYATSFYLGFGEGDVSKKYLISAKGLLKDGHVMLSDLEEEAADSLSADLKQIEKYLKSKLQRKGMGGVAIFSCSARDFFEAYYLRAPIKDRIVIKKSFYIRPLTLFLDDFKRCIVVLVDRSKARIFEAHLGEMLTYIEVTDEVPGQVREGGFKGYDEKRISRHIEDHVHRHYKNVGLKLLDLFKVNRFERLILGGRPEVVGECEKILHTYLRERVIGRFAIDSDAPIIEVFEKSKSLAEQLERQSEEKLVSKLLNNLWPQGKGTIGIDSTIESLIKGEVYSLLVSVGFIEPGYTCRECGYMSTTEEKCSLCESDMERVSDIVDELIKEAVRQRASVHHIASTLQLSKRGGVGSVLRFRV
jgi:peptide chain release factor subunit 1